MAFVRELMDRSVECDMVEIWVWIGSVLVWHTVGVHGWTSEIFIKPPSVIYFMLLYFQTKLYNYIAPSVFIGAFECKSAQPTVFFCNVNTPMPFQVKQQMKISERITPSVPNSTISQHLFYIYQREEKPLCSALSPLRIVAFFSFHESSGSNKAIVVRWMHTTNVTKKARWKNKQIRAALQAVTYF